MKNFKFKEKPKMVSTGIYIKRETLAKINFYAETNSLPVNRVINQLLELAIDSLEDTNETKCA